jgi:hypothetical protein
VYNKRSAELDPFSETCAKKRASLKKVVGCQALLPPSFRLCREVICIPPLADWLRIITGDVDFGKYPSVNNDERLWMKARLKRDENNAIR